MGKIYLSVNSKTREGGFKELGVSSKSRKLQKVYLGVSGKTRLVWQNYIAVTGVSFTYTRTENHAEDTYSDITYYRPLKVTASISPSNATNKALTWKLIWESSSPSNASYNVTFNVSSDGKTATLNVGGGISRNSSCNGIIRCTSADGVYKDFLFTAYCIRYTDKDGDASGAITIYQR